MPQGPRIITFAAAAILALGLTSLSSWAASSFEGTWNTEDTNGNPFEIVLSEDGSAKGDRHGEALKGKWKQEGESAVIDWGDGWTSKLTKDGEAYKKTAYEKGEAKGEMKATKAK